MMMQQMRKLFGPVSVDGYIKAKTKRLKKRIKESEGGN